MATSLVPAKIIGMDKDLGSVEKGKFADFLLLNKNDLEISETYISAKSVYKSE